MSVICSLAGCATVLAEDWKQPTPAELKMTSDPAAPGADAVYLDREETVDDKTHYHRIYARIKILTEKGKQKYSDIEIPYEAGMSSIRAVEGRTIHSDGTVVPFTGKPYDKELVKSGDKKFMEKVFSMPDVQVGSIIEYSWDLQYQDHWFMPPFWRIQQPLYVHHAHYHFIPTDVDSEREILVQDALGRQMVANRLLYYANLPPGAQVKPQVNGYDLVVNDVPALPSESMSPPLASFEYQVLFYYSPQFSGKDFWMDEGRIWSKDLDRFANPSPAIRQAVAGIVAPGDTDEQKVEKIYAAVMTVENTRFTRASSAAENKAEGLRVKNAADIWAQKRGSDDEITRLFIAMARAAGLKAYAGIVTERNRNLLNTGYLNWGQLEDEIAIVSIGGKDRYFDPGQRYCEFGELHWMHTMVLGIRQSDNGPALMVTPAGPYQNNATVRIAQLSLGADGTVSGVIRINMSGAEALRWRQEALRTDEEQAKKEFAAELQTGVPDGVQVKTNHFLGLSAWNSSLMAVVDVSGSVGTSAGRHVFLPSDFFEASSKAPFPAQIRQSPVDLHYAYVEQDHVTWTLPAEMQVENLPKNDDLQFAQNAVYKATFSAAGNTWQELRVMAVGQSVFKVQEYPQLRQFFQTAAADDQQQVVLKRIAAAQSAGQ